MAADGGLADGPAGAGSPAHPQPGGDSGRAWRWRAWWPSSTAWVVTAALSVGYGWLVAATRAFTWASTLVTFGLAVPLGLVAWWQRRGGGPPVLQRRAYGGRDPQTVARQAWAWWIVCSAVVVFELFELAQSPRALHPTVSSLVNPFLRGSSHRWAAGAVWVAVACWMVTR